MKLNFKRIARPISNLITSSLPIGGLEISDSSLRFLQVKNNSVTRASLRLPPGIIQDGILKSPKLFLAALQNLHRQITEKPKPVNVILVVPSNVIYAQSFSVPILDKKQMAESIDLNLQMLSPNDIDKSYYDYQEIIENKNLSTVDLLGAFAKNNVIDDYRKIVRAAGFNVIAIEFSGLSIARLINQRWTGLMSDQRYLVITLNSQGVLMLILKNGNLYFNHFTSWKEIMPAKTASKQSPDLEFAEIKEFFAREIRRVLNFYLGRFGKPLEEAILISPIFNYEIVKIVSEEFKLKIRNLAIAELPKLKPNWFAVLGAGLRGLKSRSNDTEISLTQTEAQTEYYYERALHFLAIWRNISLAVLGFIIALYGAVTVMAGQEREKLASALENSLSLDDVQLNSARNQDIATFNALVQEISSILDQETGWSGFLAKMDTLRQDSITYTRINSTGKAMDVAGISDSQQAAVSFKQRLDQDSEFLNVSLPLSNIKTNSDGMVTFSLTFSLPGQQAEEE